MGNVVKIIWIIALFGIFSACENNNTENNNNNGNGNNPPHSHSLGEWTDRITAPCIAVKVQERRCFCGYYERQNIDDPVTKPHEYEDSICIKCLSIEAVQIPSGTFSMGPDIDSVTFTVTLNSFKMCKFEVTQEQFELVMGYNFSSFGSYITEGEVKGKLPVENVSWFEAVLFCNRLSEIEGLTPLYTMAVNQNTGYAVTADWTNNGYRLPTEAQWEYACRAGTTTDWFCENEDDLDNYAWFQENAGSMPHQVGKKLPNDFGLYDMHGNIWEWCWDVWGAYPTEPQTDYLGVSSGDSRVWRGGCYFDAANNIKSTWRSSNPQAYRMNDIGFRVSLP